MFSCRAAAEMRTNLQARSRMHHAVACARWAAGLLLTVAHRQYRPRQVTVV